MQKNAAVKGQPKMKVPLSTLDIWIEIFSGAGLMFMIVFIMKTWELLPATIPSHFNALGQPDGYSGKSILLMLPVLGVVLYLLLSLARQFPHLSNYPWKITAANAQVQYRLAADLLAWLKVEIIYCFAYITWGTIQVSLGKMNTLGAAFMVVFLVAIFGTMAIYFYRAYRAR